VGARAPWVLVVADGCEVEAADDACVAGGAA
jgi:hypothetical protein